MYKLEQTLVDIESQMTDAISKQQLTVARTIYDVAGDSIMAARTLDEEFRAVFPELSKFEPDAESDSPSAPFNPKFIIEIREGKCNKFVNAWDKDPGFLPGRKVVCYYYIDIGLDTDLFIASDKHNNGFCVKCKKEFAFNNNWTIANIPNSKINLITIHILLITQHVDVVQIFILEIIINSSYLIVISSLLIIYQL